MSQSHHSIGPVSHSTYSRTVFPRKLGTYDAPLETWKVVLRLATQYQFSEVRNLAFRELDILGKSNMSLVERIVLYRQYDADRKYLDPLYEELLSRPKPLSSEEGEAFGLATALLIARAREQLRVVCDKLNPQSPLPDSMKKAVTKMVSSAFWGGSAPDSDSTSGGTTKVNGSSSSQTTPDKTKTAPTLLTGGECPIFAYLQ